jgi:hypothetical protein
MAKPRGDSCVSKVTRYETSMRPYKINVSQSRSVDGTKGLLMAEILDAEMLRAHSESHRGHQNVAPGFQLSGPEGAHAREVGPGEDTFGWCGGPILVRRRFAKSVLGGTPA